MDLPTFSPQTKNRTHPGSRPTSLAGFFARKLPLAVARTAFWLQKFFRRVGAFVVTVVQEFIKDDCMNLAAQISYYALFSIFPLLLGAVLLLSWIFNDPLDRVRLVSWVVDIFPSNSIDVGRIVNETLNQSQEYRPLIFVFFFISLIWGGSGIFDSITNALNKAWQTPGQQRGIIESLTLRFLLLGIFVLILIGSIGVTLVFDVLRNFAKSNPELNLFIKGHSVWDWPSFVLPWVINFVTFLVIYRVVPQRKVTWWDVWPGALMATGLFEVVKLGFTFYVTQIVHYSATYGSLGGVIIFIFWLYLIALVLLIGGEVSSVYAEMRGEKRPTKLARQGKLNEAEPKPPLPDAEPEPKKAGDPSLQFNYDCEDVFCVYAGPPDKIKAEPPEITAAAE